jgi:hypothetical protein
MIHMIQVLKLLFMNLILASSAFAGVNHAVNQLCKDANFSKLELGGLSGKYEGDIRDFCGIPDAQIPEEVRKSVGELIKVHQKVLSFINERFGVKMEHLTSKPIEMAFAGAPGGNLESISGFDPVPVLQLGVFMDWSGGEIDLSSYVHELGHLLILDPESPLPNSILKIGKLKQFYEQIPDALALTITGKAIGNPGMPDCVSDAIRGFSYQRTFKSPAQSFYPLLQDARLAACCSRSESLMPLYPNFPQVCNTALINLRQTGDRLKVKSIHEISAPITSFLLGLAEAKGSGTDLSFYFQAFNEIEEASPQALFSVVRENLNPEQQKTFDKLWKHYGMSFGISKKFIAQ